MVALAVPLLYVVNSLRLAYQLCYVALAKIKCVK